MKESITKETQISDLLDSTAFAQEMNNLTDSIMGKIFDRKDKLLTETTAGMNEEQLLNDESYLYNKANDTYDLYENARLALDSFINKSVMAAAEEQIEELNVLKTKIQDNNTYIDCVIRNYENTYAKEMEDAEPTGFAAIVGATAATKTKKLAIEYKYYNKTEPLGLITIEQNKKNSNNERIEEINQKIKEAEEVYSVYSQG